MANAMKDALTPAEVSVVAGVPLRDVNRVIDERILPARYYSVGADRIRLFRAGACSLIAFYFQAAGRLTSEERIRTIVATRADHFDSGSPARQWMVRSEFLTIDLSSFVRETQARMDRLAQARALVVEDAEILGGVPVILGTRVPVYDVAASVAAGEPMERILAAYSGLNAESVELAVLYAQANPLRGRRRRGQKLPEGAVVLTSRKMPRTRG